MTTIIEIPLNSGMDQGTDRVLQGQDKLTLAQNCRLARDGRLELRPSFTALSANTFSSASMTAYDVTTYAGRLVALGDQCSQSRPTDLFEWIPSRSRWRATAGDDITAAEGVRLPQLTNIRALGMLPDFPESTHTVGLAAGGGYVCVVAERLGVGSTIHVFDPATNQSLLIEEFAATRPQVVYSGTTFFIVGVDSDEDIVMTSIAPGSAQVLAAVTTLVSNATTVEDLAAKVCGTGWVLCYATTTSAVAYRYNSSGVQQATWTAFASSTSSVAIACNAAGSLISIARQDATQDYFVTTFNAAGAVQTGPTALFSGEGNSGRRLGMELNGLNLEIVGVDELNSLSLYQTAVQTTHALGTLRHYYDARPEGAPVVCNGKCYIGFVDLTATNFTQGTYHVVETSNFLPQAFLGAQLCDTTTTGANEIQYMAAEGTKLYFCVITIGQDNGAVLTGLKYRFTVYEAETAATSKRQMVQVGGELLVAGGLPLTYDGRTMVEQGFAEKPVITFESEATTPGTLQQLATYQAIAVWEVYDSKGRLLRSQPSDPVSHTLTATNDTINWRVTTPHSLRRHPAFADQAQTIRVSVYRTEADEGVFFIDTQVTVPLADDVAEFVTVQSRFPDSQLIDNAILYTQSQAAISNVSPGPYRYVYPARERAFAGGLPEEEAWKFSKLLFPGEPLEWAFDGRLGFSGRVGQPITAVGAFETAALIWTEQEIWMVPGRGPEHNGTGEFDPSTPIATPGGAYNWQSVIVAPPGAFFQMMPDRLMLLDRGGAVSWIGSPVQDTLALYPEISGCVFVRQLDIVVFACNNSLGTDGVFLVYDMTNGQWYVDTIGAAITAVAEFEGRLVYVSGGTVRMQDLTIGLGVGAMPTMIFETPSYRFFSALGYGDIIKVALLGTYLGDSTVGLEISYDDGKNWTTADTFAVTSAAMTSNQTGAALASGDPITLIWTPARMETDRFRLRFTMSNATATGGCRFHLISLEVEGNLHTTRKPSGNQR